MRHQHASLLGLLLFCFLAFAEAQSYAFVGSGESDVVSRLNSTGFPTDERVLGILAFDQFGRPFNYHGPRGIFRINKELFVAWQNPGTPFFGAIVVYNSANGNFKRVLVSPFSNNASATEDNTNGVFAPRGMIYHCQKASRTHKAHCAIYVADFSHPQNADGNGTDGVGPSGAVLRYSPCGRFLGALSVAGLNISDTFRPRGLVIGPDGMLYVSSGLQGLPGYILKFNPIQGFISVVASYQRTSDCSQDLHRPEGLVFSPDGKKIFITAFRANVNDTDRILVFNPSSGACVDKIDLHRFDEERVFAQSLIFGPHGRLFVPLQPTGVIRRYHVATKTFDVFGPNNTSPTSIYSTNPLLRTPFFMILDGTDPGTLQYKRPHKSDDC